MDSCHGSPPKLWRHWGCGRWDCGDLGGLADNCKKTPSGSKCSPPQWNCSHRGHIDPQGSFACLKGEWLDILPLCVGSTSPGVRGGHWEASQKYVRAVLFKLAVSWTPPTSYRPRVCTNPNVWTTCRQVEYGELIELNMWPLVAQPLQDALCKPSGNPLNPGSCTGVLSTRVDRLRVAGTQEGEANGTGTLTIYIDMVPGLADDAEQLLDDVNAFRASLGSEGVSIDAAEVWNGDASPLDTPIGWFRSGLVQLKTTPHHFGIDDRDLGLKDKHRFPDWHVAAAEPYILNRYIVPDWRLDYGPTFEADRYEGLIASLKSVDTAILFGVCTLLGTIWLSTLSLRCCCYSFLYGSYSRWTLAQTARIICFLALFTDGVHVGVLLVVLGMTLKLASEEVYDPETGSSRPQLGALLLPVAGLIMLPSLSLSWILFRSPGTSSSSGKDQGPPVPERLCFFRVRSRSWFRFFACAVIWHAFGMILLMAVAAWRLSDKPLGAEDARKAQSETIAACNGDFARYCTDDGATQLPDFDVWRREVCARDCSAVPVPLDPASRLEELLHEFQILMSAWSIPVRMLQLAMVWAYDKYLSHIKYQAMAFDGDIQHQVVAPIEPVALGAVKPNSLLAPDPIAVKQAKGTTVRGEYLEADEQDEKLQALHVKSGSVDLEMLASSLHDNLEPPPPLVAASPDPTSANALSNLLVPLPKADSDNISKTSSRSKHSKSSKERSRSPQSSRSEMGEVETPQDQAGGTNVSDLANRIAGDERNYLDFAVMVARECSRDSFASQSSRGSIVSSRSTQSANAPTSAQAGKKRFVADW